MLNKPAVGVITTLFFTVLQSLQQSGASCSPLAFRPTTLVIDFDKTITVNDTLALLAENSPYYLEKNEPTWDYFTELWMSENAKLQKSAKQPLEFYTGPSKYELTNTLNSYFQQFRQAETKAIKSVNSSGILQGYTSEALHNIGFEIPIQPGFAEFIDNWDAEFFINSLNWSRDMIYGTLSRYTECIEYDNILGNNLEYAEAGDIGFSTTGKVLGENHNACDKVNTMSRLPSEGMLYFGDSTGDLAALMYAEVGVLIGSPSSTIKSITSQLNIELAPIKDLENGKHLDSPTIYHGSWPEINKVFAEVF